MKTCKHLFPVLDPGVSGDTDCLDLLELFFFFVFQTHQRTMTAWTMFAAALQQWQKGEGADIA